MKKVKITIDENKTAYWGKIPIGHIIENEEGELELLVTAPVGVLEQIVSHSSFQKVSE